MGPEAAQRPLGHCPVGAARAGWETLSASLCTICPLGGEGPGTLRVQLALPSSSGPLSCPVDRHF